MKKKKIKRLRPVMVRLTERDRQILQAKAQEFTEGNLSAWLRHAGKNYEPGRIEKILIRT